MPLLKKKKDPEFKQRRGYGGDKEAGMKGVHRTALGKGESEAGKLQRKLSKPGENYTDKDKMVDDDSALKAEHEGVLEELKAMKKPKLLAKGGMACGDELFDKMMADRYSMGGKVSNDSAPTADDLPAEYDYLVLNDDLEEHYTGANSGDELGSEEETKRRNQIVAEVMMKRRKQHNPRPA